MTPFYFQFLCQLGDLGCKQVNPTRGNLSQKMAALDRYPLESK